MLVFVTHLENIMKANQILEELNAFMGKMRENDSKEPVENMQAAIDYLLEKLHIYEEKFSEATGRKRPELNDNDRRRLAARARVMNPSMLDMVEDTWMPDTLMTWYRVLIADKYNSYKGARKRGGRPAISMKVIDAIIQIARENPSWGYDRVASYLAYLGHPLSPRTVKRIMNEQGLFPTDWTKKGGWQRFFDAHRNVLASCDFATYELLTPNGLVREHILFFEDITTREVWLGGITHNPDGNWMSQVARNQTDAIDGKLNGMKYLIHDSDPLYKGRFYQYITQSGCKAKCLPPKSPELNSFIESFIKTIKVECLNHFILQTEEQLRYVVTQYLEYYNHERPHSGIGGTMIHPRPQDEDGKITMFSRLGGFLKSYRKIKSAS